MDFFDHQDRARKKSRWLVLFLALAVVGIVLAVYVAAMLFLVGIQVKSGVSQITGLWRPDLFLAVALITLAVVTLGSLYKMISLRDGGAGVAQSMGGEPLDPNTSVLAERRLLNVVEEMALASGVPVPTVYVLRREQGINAFAAGHTPADAVIGVTAGCLELLTRDELQGVIAHEFSHILNGDMRLDLRLIGLLHGILLLALIGYYVLRGSFWSGGGRRRGSGGWVLLFGLALVVIGSVGVFFGRLIKSGVSRQRELLADASAVQFTRNPSGISGALKKIGGLTAGSRIHSPVAEEMSHLYFGNGVGKPLFAWLATHPPLVERIRAIEPQFDGIFPVVERPATKAGEAARPESSGKRPGFEPLTVASAVAAASLGSASATTAPTPRLSERVGRLDQEHVTLVRELRRDIPESLAGELRDPSGALSVVYAVLLDDDTEAEKAQLEYLRDHNEAWVYAQVLRQRRVLRELGDEVDRMRLPLVELAIPALRRLSPEQFRSFSEQVSFLVEADRKVQLFEYAIQRLLARRLAPHFGAGERSRVQYYALGRLKTEVSVLLSGLAHLSGEEERERAFAAAVAELQKSAPGCAPQLLSTSECRLPQIDAALRQLVQVTPRLKRVLIDAAAAAVISDRRVTVAEGELLRAVADALDCPMPPFLRSAGTESAA